MTIPAIHKDLKFNQATMWIFIFITIASWMIFIPSTIVELNDYKKKYNELDEYQSSIINKLNKLDGELSDTELRIKEVKTKLNEITSVVERLRKK